ncbi:MAG: terminase family protein [Pseudomonadota bacterium]
MRLQLSVWHQPIRNALQSEDGHARAMDAALACPFLIEAHAAQRPPVGDWRNWLFLGGRGAGKTRAGAEWVRFAVEQLGARRIALVGATLHDVRETMIEGASGLCSLVPAHGRARPAYESSRRRLEFDTGAIAYAFSAEDPDQLRGPQFDLAWCDEIAAWGHGGLAWHQMQLALRLGPTPRAMATTTPRPVELIRQLIKDTDTAITRASTIDNSANLSPDFAQRVAAQLPTEELVRQELKGELLDGGSSVFWTRKVLDQCRRNSVLPSFEDIVVAIDPPASQGPRADMCGIVAAGRFGQTADGDMSCILADASVQGLSPMDWAARAISVAGEVGAVSIVAEANQGGEMVRQVLLAAGCRLPIRLVHASVSKSVRAHPVSALYRQGRVFHFGLFPDLEKQMLAFGTDGQSGSPDRVDALVWAVWSLMIAGGDAPRVRSL